MNCEIKSKICISLKSINNINLDKLSKKAENIEFRLDYINLNDIALLTDLDKFERIILKIIDFKQILTVNNLFRNSKNLYLDIDLDLFENYINMIYGIEKLIISKHNLDLYNFNDIILKIKQLSHLNNISILKLIFNQNSNKYCNKNVLTKIYQNVQVISEVPIISFFEGEKSSFSRIYSLFLGAPFLYCGLDKNSLTGKGQLTLDEVYKYLDLLRSFNKHD